MAGWASKHGGQKRGRGERGDGGLNARLVQQQMGLELLRHRGSGASTGTSSKDLLQQHQQQAQLMSARNGAWQLNGVANAWMLGRGMEAGGQPLYVGGAPGRGGAGHLGGLVPAVKSGGELDGYGMLQTQQVEIDGKLHTMFCLPAESPPRGNVGLQATPITPALGFYPFDYNNAARASEKGILGGGPADARWAQPRSPRRAPPTIVPPMSPRRSRSPYRQRRLSPQRHGNAGLLSTRSLSRHFRARDVSPRSPRQRGNPPLLHRNEQGLLPRPPLWSLEPHHLLPKPISEDLLSHQLFGGPIASPRREGAILGRDALSSGDDYLKRARDLASPPDREYLRRSSPDFGRPSLSSVDLIRGARGVLGAARGAKNEHVVLRDRRRRRSREHNKGRQMQDLDTKTCNLSLEETIAAKRSKLPEDARKVDKKHEYSGEWDKVESFRAKVSKARAHYARVLEEDTVRRKKYKDAKNGRGNKLECLVCGRYVINLSSHLYVLQLLDAAPSCRRFPLLLTPDVLPACAVRASPT